MTKRDMIVVSLLCLGVGVSAPSARADSAERFAKLDANADGLVSLQEFEGHALARFVQADTNQDGKLSVEERIASYESRGRERFRKQDLNRDGVLERSEVEHMPREVFFRIDADKSGGLNPRELKSYSQVRRAGRQQEVDRDGDGALSKTEILADARTQFAKLDGNRDGRVDIDEFLARRRTPRS